MSSLVKDMQNAFYKHTFQRYEMLAPNVYLDGSTHEMDLMGIRRRSNYVDEVEIKISRSDYLKDFKKTVYIQEGSEYVDKSKHELLESGLINCNYFSFLLPKELADKFDDIPEYSGLYVYHTRKSGKGYISEVKSAPLLHKRKIEEDTKYKIGRKLAYRYWNLLKED